MKELKSKIQSLAKQYLPETIAIRRHLHANPELSFEEYNTSNYIASKLTECCFGTAGSDDARANLWAQLKILAYNAPRTELYTTPNAP